MGTEQAAAPSKRRVDERTERFRALFDACYRPVCAYARRRIGPADVDDLVADVFAAAWRRLDDIPRDRELPWLYGVARLTLANHRRGAARRERLAVRVARAVPAPATSRDDEFDTVHRALARLRPDEREILRLAAWEQLRTAEIATVLGCSDNAAALRLSRARQRFREQLTAFDDSRTQAARKVTDA